MDTIRVFGSQLSFLSQTNLFGEIKFSHFPVMLFPRAQAKHVCLKATPTPTFDANRTFKKLLPSTWTHHFLSVSADVSEMDALQKEIGLLKPKVKDTFMSSQAQETDSTKKRILMIYELVSLGIAYHFEEEIDVTLKVGFGKIEEMMTGENDLYTVSTVFRVFRTYGHYISSEVFRRFKGSDGNFKECLKGDAKGMLSLYEAAHLRTTKDYILEEAFRFSSSHLESLAACRTCSPHLSKCIRNALGLSQNCNMDMLVALDFMPFYENEKNHDKMLLKFAKLNFKFLQLQYLQEIKSALKWYKEVDFASNLPPFFRDRPIENHFLVQMAFFEPHLSRKRMMLIRYFIILVLHDDTFDRYASLPEAESLANSLNRWGPDDAMNKQPDYLKFVFKLILDTFEDLEQELRPEERSYIMKATIEEFKILVKANFELEKWAVVAHVPSFEKYIEIAGEAFAVPATLAGIFMCTGTMVATEAFEWLKSRPKLVQALCIKGRLLNDIAGFKEDMSRGYGANAVTCYIKQYGVTEKEALNELKQMVTDADKLLNEELLTTNGASRLIHKAATGVSVMLVMTYTGYDVFTHPQGKMKEYLTSIFGDRICL